MANTTAKQRELAKLYESRGEWKLAALCWQAAHDMYPAVTGQLAERDKRLLAERAKECRNAA